MASQTNNNLFQVIVSLLMPPPSSPTRAQSPTKSPEMASSSRQKRPSIREHPVLQRTMTNPAENKPDPFDFQATVSSLTSLFSNEFEETRIASIDWLLMLHKKLQNKVAFLIAKQHRL